MHQLDPHVLPIHTFPLGSSCTPAMCDASRHKTATMVVGSKHCTRFRLHQESCVQARRFHPSAMSTQVVLTQGSPYRSFVVPPSK